MDLEQLRPVAEVAAQARVRKAVGDGRVPEAEVRAVLQEMVRDHELPSQACSFESYLRGFDEVEARLAGLDREVLELAEKSAWKALVADLRCLKGVDTLGAVTLAVEVRDFRRFPEAAKFMGYTGLVSCECSSSESVRRGRITKVGNAHVRRTLIEAAWTYARPDQQGGSWVDRRDLGKSRSRKRRAGSRS